MPTMPKVHRPPGSPTPAERARFDRDRRGTRHEQGYTNAWARARALYLSQHPLCVMCLALGKVMPANVVDHIIPHRRNQDLFWDEANWQSLCAPCHNGPKRRQELAQRRSGPPAPPSTEPTPGAGGGPGRGVRSQKRFHAVARLVAIVFAPVFGDVPVSKLQQGRPQRARVVAGHP